MGVGMGFGVDDGLLVVGLGLVGVGVWLLAGWPGVMIVVGLGLVVAGVLRSGAPMGR